MKTKLCLFMFIFAVVQASLSIPIANGSPVPYEGYSYDYWGKPIPSPAAYLPSTVITGKELGIGHFNKPEDLFVTDDQHIYLLDSGNKRVIHFDSQWNIVNIIDHFQNEGKQDQFNKPEGIFVTEEGYIYVADTENRRVIQLENDGTFIREIGEPTADVIRDNFQYFPRKIALDKAKRIYVIGRGVFDGIIEFDADGHFSGFMGTNRVRFNPIDYLWKRLSTDAQREKLTMFVPIEFNNLDLDDEGFIYSTTSEQNTRTPIQRLNPAGTDVLRREGYYPIAGDLVYSYVGENSGTSVFVDIDVNNYGVYSALDSRRGRIFTYNDDGNLMYIFGQRGSQVGTFKDPVAINRLGEQILVLDRDLNQIIAFEPTLFGQKVNDAVQLHYNGNSIESARLWKEVINLNANYEIAYTGIGKALLRQEKNEEALTYFKMGMSRKYYSKAYERFRKDVMRDQFGTVMTLIVTLIVGMFGYRTFRRARRRRLDFDA